MIVGRFNPNDPHPVPWMRVAVFLGGISTKWTFVDFVLDTGAGTTCLHPRDALAAGVSPLALLSPASWPSATNFHGIGGAMQYYATPVRYALQHDDGTWQYIDGTVSVAQFRPENAQLPSLLGWDVLREFEVVTNWRDGRVELHRLGQP